MIISHKYKFIFIKTRKTAGTSIEIFLSQHCGNNDILTPIEPHVDPHRARNHEGSDFYHHMTALELRDYIHADVWHEYYKFCVERNPWDKTLSHYHMLDYRAGGNMSLEEYFAAGKYCLNYPQYTDDLNQPIVDNILKYEQLSEDLSLVFSLLGVPFTGNLGALAKSEYRTDKRPYREVLSDNQAEVISSVFSKEIALHGYTY